MSFLSKIFKKKAGGSGIGNIFRGVVKTVTGGLLGKGNGVIPKEFDFNKDGKISEGEKKAWEDYKKTGVLTSLADGDPGDYLDYTETDKEGGSLGALSGLFDSFGTAVQKVLNPTVTIETGKKTNIFLGIGVGLLAIFVIKGFFTSNRNR